jgi:ubiquinone/menaquinone biosynthesis C-methylase UbiE
LKKSAEGRSSYFEYNHGRSPLLNEIEDLSNRELIAFIDPKPSEVILDAGCRTGANIALLSPSVRRVIGMDYNKAAVERTQRHLGRENIGNVEVLVGGITDIPLGDRSVDKIICMSVLQYLNDAEVQAFGSLGELTDKGILIIHVKNIASVYLSTLWAVKSASYFG